MTNNNFLLNWRRCLGVILIVYGLTFVWFYRFNYVLSCIYLCYCMIWFDFVLSDVRYLTFRVFYICNRQNCTLIKYS